MKKINLTKGVFTVLLLASTMAVAETEYPASDFKPAILFQDLDANKAAKQHKPSTAAPTATTQSRQDVSVTTAVEPSVSSAKDSSNTNALIGLAVLAAAGFFFFTRQSKGQAKRSTYGGLTGVARYLQSIEKASGTGVSRYLDKKVGAAKEKAESTGVAKYLRDRG